MKPRYSFSSKHTRNIENIRKQRPKYTELALKVIDESDIILEVLDARFIDETRNKELEELIVKKKKKLIFIINKYDLVDVKNLNKTLLKELMPYCFVSCKEREGIKDLRKKIQIASKRVDKKPLTSEQEKLGFDNRIKVGVIGYPNTGKSSLINILVGKSSAGVGSDAGFTRGIQKVKLSSNVVLVDTPGVIPRDEYHHSKTEKLARHTKLNARASSQVRNPENVVTLIMEEHPELLEKHYNIDAKGDVDYFLEELGKKRGFLKKGGETNTDMGARVVLKDWQTGKIKL